MHSNSLKIENVLLDKDLSAFREFIIGSEYSSIVVLCDKNTARECYPLIENVLPIAGLNTHLIVIEAGEENKEITSAQYIWEKLSEEKIDRKALMVNCGGGMITDIGGFAASLYKRGIDFVHLPTSLLAMADAAIGGKCGIDFKNYKNQIGVFSLPEKVFIHPDFLKSLNKEELKSGMAEVFKHALIYDRSLWEELSLDIYLPSNELILRAATVKMQIVKEDPLENGSRKILNYGHSIGHAIESYYLSQASAIPHGFAVAAGMVCEAFLSNKLHKLPNHEFNSIVSALKKNFPKLDFKEPEISSIVDLVAQDKKNKMGRNLFVLLSSIGKAEFDIIIESQEITDALAFYVYEF